MAIRPTQTVLRETSRGRFAQQERARTMDKTPSGLFPVDRNPIRAPASRPILVDACDGLSRAFGRSGWASRYPGQAEVDALAALVDADASRGVQRGDGGVTCSHRRGTTAAIAVLRLADAVLGLEAVRAELADVQASDTSLGGALDRAREALIIACCYVRVNPHAKALAAHGAPQPEDG